MRSDKPHEKLRVLYLTSTVDKVSAEARNERLDAFWRLLGQDYLMGSPVTFPS
jgi:hypothetical protein